jgi:hypothetical protein
MYQKVNNNNDKDAENGKCFEISLYVPITGIHYYYFLVDGEERFAHESPQTTIQHKNEARIVNYIEINQKEVETSSIFKEDLE